MNKKLEDTSFSFSVTDQNILKEKNKGGRPKSDSKADLPVRVYFTGEEKAKLVEALDGRPLSVAIKRAVLEKYNIKEN